MRAIHSTLLAAAASAALAGPAAAAPRADLTVTKLSEPPAALQAGATLMVTDTVRNASRAKAKKTAVVYWLSADRRKGRGDVRVGRRSVKALNGRRSARGRATLALPAALAAGAYHLIACADGTGKVKERSERNNCRASRRRLAVTPLALPGEPALPGPTPVTPVPTATPTPAPTPTDDPPAAPDFPLAADPLSVTHTLDTANAVTRRAEVTQFSGATLSTTGEDGTEFTLELPPGSLVSPVDITLTPVKAVNGSPFSDGLVGAVEILPHGLELLKPAILTIIPGGPAGSVESQTGFLSHDEGEDFHLYPLERGAALKMELMHFSTPGVAQATDAERQVVLGHPPERLRAQLAQEIAELLRRARVAAETDENAGLPSEELAAILEAYYTGVVDPAVQQALVHDAKVAQGIAELVGWARRVALLGLREHPDLKEWSDNALIEVAAIIENAINRAYTRCVDQHDLDDIVRLVSLARAAAVVGSPVGQEALDKARRCANFELEFSSKIVQDYTLDGFNQDHRGIGTWHVVAEHVPIGITGVNPSFPMTWKLFDYEYTVTYNEGDCARVVRTVDVSATPDTQAAVLLEMDLNLREPGAPPPPDRGIRLRLFQYESLEESYYRSTPQACGGEPSEGPEERATWRTTFDHLHDPAGVFENWEMGSGDLVATKFSNHTRPGDGISEQTTLELWHKPDTTP